MSTVENSREEVGISDLGEGCLRSIILLAVAVLRHQQGERVSCSQNYRYLYPAAYFRNPNDVA